MTKNINVSMTDELYDEFEKVRKSYGMSRSGFVQFALKQIINNEKVINSIPEIKVMYSDLYNVLDEFNKNISSLKTEK